MGLLLVLCSSFWSDAAPPKPKAAQPVFDGDHLPSGQFAGVLVRVPKTDRMFTLKITYPEIRLKPGAKLPPAGNIRMPNMQNIAREYAQMQRLQQQMAHNMNHHHAIHNMMQLQQAYLQMQMNQQQMAAREMQLAARIQQQEVRAEQQLLRQELQLLRRQIQAIRNMYQVVQVSRNFDFQAAENVKVRLKDLPDRFDDKGRLKKYSRQEMSNLKGKDKNLPGYESTLDSLKPGQTVLVVLRAYKKPAPSAKLKNLKNPDKIDDGDAAIQHKMQVRTIVILRDSQTPPKKTVQAKKK